MAHHPIPPTPTGVDTATWESMFKSIRAYCNWHIAPNVSETITVDGPGCSTLFLPTLHLTELTAVTNDGAPVADPEWSESGMVRGASWSSRFRGVTVTMTHGYEDWPAELVTTAAELITAFRREGANSVVTNSHQIRFEGPMSERQRDVLDRYRLMVLP